MIGVPDKALECSSSSLKIMLDFHDEIHLLTAQSYNNLAAAYDIIGDIDTALINAKKCL